MFKYYCNPYMRIMHFIKHTKWDIDYIWSFIVWYEYNNMVIVKIKEIKNWNILLYSL